MRTPFRRLVGAALALGLFASPVLAAPAGGGASWWNQLVEWLASWRPVETWEVRGPRVLSDQGLAHSSNAGHLQNKIGPTADPWGRPLSSSEDGTDD